MLRGKTTSCYWPIYWRAGLYFAAFVALLILMLVPARAEEGLTSIRLGDTGKGTRIVFDLSQPIEPKLFLLDAPARLVVDFSNVDVSNLAETKTRGLVSGLRYGLFDPQTYRVVFDLKELAVVDRAFALGRSGNISDRFVVDLLPASRDAFLKAVRATKGAAPKRARVITPNRVQNVRKGGKRVIVLDPGHGGVDPGTLGVLGVNEKVITLNVAREIARQLEATGRYTTRLTRTRDIYLPHRQRYGIAHEAGADLFISIHADSIADPRVRGGTIYTLSETASDREAARLAAKVNKSDVIAGLNLGSTDTVVSSILIDLAQRETLNASVAFAQMLLPEMREQVRMHKRGHRFANLLVLKSIDVPSILLETGYLTNRSDAQLLNSRSGQRKIARGVVGGIDRYFSQRTASAR